MKGKRKKIQRLSFEFSTLNDPEKNYILTLARALASMLETRKCLSDLSKGKSQNFEKAEKNKRSSL